MNNIINSIFFCLFFLLVYASVYQIVNRICQAFERCAFFKAAACNKQFLNAYKNATEEEND